MDIVSDNIINYSYNVLGNLLSLCYDNAPENRYNDSMKEYGRLILVDLLNFLYHDINTSSYDFGKKITKDIINSSCVFMHTNCFIKYIGVFSCYLYNQFQYDNVSKSDNKNEYISSSVSQLHIIYYNNKDYLITLLMECDDECIHLYDSKVNPFSIDIFIDDEIM